MLNAFKDKSKVKKFQGDESKIKWATYSLIVLCSLLYIFAETVLHFYDKVANHTIYYLS